jgi:hypothetical protein
MRVYEGARGLDGAIVIVDGKPLPPRHGEPTSRRNSPRNRWFESVSLQRGVSNEPVPAVVFAARRSACGALSRPGERRSSAGTPPPEVSTARGTEGSNPPPSSGESVSALNPSAGGEESRGFAAVCSCMGT